MFCTGYGWKKGSLFAAIDETYNILLLMQYARQCRQCNCSYELLRDDRAGMMCSGEESQCCWGGNEAGCECE